ncbi:MAG: hypothetical protein IKZ99_07590 [Salinivirgaceae bacterium]|nr:hypothetical protein [Salinivirgaceae bacterium]
MGNRFFKVLGMSFVVTLFAGCKETRSVDELSKLFDGIFLLDAKWEHEPENSLHYIVFYQDCTYIHKYILNGDTLINNGAWSLGKYKRSNKFYFDLYHWIPYGNDPFPLRENETYNDERSVMPYFGTKNDDWAGLRFHIDLGYDFVKISKQEADRLGIKEDSITWHRLQEYSWERIEREVEEEKMNKDNKRK